MLDMPYQMPATWTDQRVELLKSMWMEGSSASEIAAVLGKDVTRSAVIGKVRRLKLHRGTTTAGRKQESRATIAIQRHKGHKGKLQPNAIVHRTANRPVIIAEEAIDPGVDVTHLLGIMDLRHDTCRFPIGDPRSSSFGFCGKHTAEGKPYCADHCKTAYVQDR